MLKTFKEPTLEKESAERPGDRADESEISSSDQIPHTTEETRARV